MSEKKKTTTLTNKGTRRLVVGRGPSSGKDGNLEGELTMVGSHLDAMDVSLSDEKRQAARREIGGNRAAVLRKSKALEVISERNKIRIS